MLAGMLCRAQEISIENWDKYCKQLDTLVLEKSEGYFIVYNDSVKSWGYRLYTQTEIEDMGYRYAFSWMIDKRPLRIKYFFIEVPTFEKFIEWLKEQNHEKI